LSVEGKCSSGTTHHIHPPISNYRRSEYGIPGLSAAAFRGVIDIYDPLKAGAPTPDHGRTHPSFHSKTLPSDYSPVSCFFGSIHACLPISPNEMKRLKFSSVATDDIYNEMGSFLRKILKSELCDGIDY
jgi:hypothetical protein